MGAAKIAPKQSTEQELLSALKGLIQASGHMSPFGGTASVANVRLAGKYMKALDFAQAAIAKAEAK